MSFFRTNLSVQRKSRFCCHDVQNIEYIRIFFRIVLIHINGILFSTNTLLRFTRSYICT